MSILAICLFSVSISSANSLFVKDDEQICSAAPMAAGDAAEENGADSVRAFEIANETYEACME